MTFLYPLALLLLPLPWLQSFLQRRLYRGEALPIIAPFLSQDKKKRTLHYFFTQATTLLIWGLAVLALTRPVQLGTPITKESNNAYTLMLALDISDSMEEKVFDRSSSAPPLTRLEVAKHFLSNLLPLWEGERVGMLVFGTMPYLLSPPTYDIEFLLESTERIRTGWANKLRTKDALLPSGVDASTSIWDSVLLATRSVDPAFHHHVLVLISDGRDTGSYISKAAATHAATLAHMKIYSLLVGGDAEGESALKSLSKSTGGAFYHASNDADAEALYKRLQSKEAPPKKQPLTKVQKEYYPYPLSLALILFFLRGVYYQRRALWQQAIKRITLFVRWIHA